MLWEHVAVGSNPTAPIATVDNEGIMTKNKLIILQLSGAVTYTTRYNKSTGGCGPFMLNK